MTSPTLPTTVYELVGNLHEQAEDLRLASLEWGFLFAVDGRHSTAQVEQLFGVDSEPSVQAWQRLLDLGLIRERELTYGEYLRAAATSGGENLTLRAFLQSGAAWTDQQEQIPVISSLEPPIGPNLPADVDPAKTTLIPTTIPTEISGTSTPEAPNQAPVSSVAPFSPLPPQDPATVSSMPPESAPVTSQNFDPTITRAVPTMSRQEILAFRPLSSPASSSASSSSAPTSPEGQSPAPAETEAPSPAGRTTQKRRPMSLRALMSYILDRAPDLSSGQLDVYRVFIRVDSKLLKRNGITTLRFEEDRQIEDPELQGAIASSLKTTLGILCPEQVFV